MLIVRVHRLAQKTHTIIDDVVVGALRKTKLLYLVIVSVFVGLDLGVSARRRPLGLGGRGRRDADPSGHLDQHGAPDLARELPKDEDDGANRTTMNALSFLGRIALWAIVLLLILDNLGIDVTALVAGLGIGGIAIALAVQNVLSDLFASLSIVLDKPFVNGDFVVVGEMAGSVEHIGIKTTRIRSISGEQLVFSNTDLLGEPHPQLRPDERAARRLSRWASPTKRQRRSSSASRADSRSHRGAEKVRFDRSHFASYGDSALNFETVYYVESSDYATHMDILQAVNLRIYRSFADEGIEFAYPTQTLFIEKL